MSPSGASAPGTPTPSDPASASQTPTSVPDISLAFAGDIHFARQLEPRLDDPDSEWADRLPQLAAADLAVANLETAIATEGRPEAKRFTFRAPPKALTVLKTAGIDVLSMANNHAADYGRSGVRETLAAIADSPVPVVGFGADEKQAFAPATVDVKGVRVGVVAATAIEEETARNWAADADSPGVATALDDERLRAATRAAVASHDVVVAYLHWGTEGTTCPNERQRALARNLSQDGADVVVGTHAHRPQGSGMLGRTFVGYGLGNYVWYNPSPGSRSSGVLTVTLDGARIAEKRARAGDQRAGAPALVTASEWVPRLIAPSGIPRDPAGQAGELDRLADAAQGCAKLDRP